MNRAVVSLLVVFGAFFLLNAPYFASADRIQELQQKIEEREGNISVLESEIEEYTKKIQETKQEAQTLSTAIDELDITRSKLNTDINVTEEKIETTNLSIEKIIIEIDEKEDQIKTNRDIIGKSMRELRKQEDNSLVEIFLKYDTFSEFWGNINNLESIQEEINSNLNKLEDRKQSLQLAKEEAQGFKDELVDLSDTLSDQKYVADVARDEKNSLLRETNNKQSNYEKLLEEKRAKKAAFEAELQGFEDELKVALDPSAIPDASPGALMWPVENIIITQYFGNTKFATENPSVYNGRGHNGIDLGVPIGTPIHSTRGGVIKGVGNTDATCPNASYGKWMLVEHDNGLSALYAHLSLISSNTGQNVSRGEIIGYSGNTGYSTGPHLHFTVFASDAVEIGNLSSRSCSGSTYSIPLLKKTGGYLNPLSYLPPQ